MRPLARSSFCAEQRVVDPLLAGEVDLHQLRPALLGHLRDRPVFGHAGVVDDDVDPVGELGGDLLRRVVGGDVEPDRAAADRLGHRLAGRRPSGGMSRPTTSAPSRARVSAIAAPIPREAPVTSATLPASGWSQSIFGVGGDALADPDHLAGDVGRARREQEAQGRVELVLGAGLDVDELRGRAAAADLLGRASG